MHCPVCEKEVSETAVVCDHCGFHLKPKCPQCGATLSREAKKCVWCGLQLSDAAIRLDTGPPTLPSEPLPTQHVGGEPKDQTIQAQERAGETETPSANSEALLQRCAASPPGSSDVRSQVPKTFGWLLLAAGGAFLVTGFVAGIDLFLVFRPDAWRLPTIVIALLNAGCGAALVMAGTRRVTTWSHARVAAVGFTSFLVPLPFLFRFSFFLASVIYSQIWVVLGFEAALVILLIVADEMPFGNSVRQVARSMLGKLQFAALPMVGMAVWVLVPDAATGLLIGAGVDEQERRLWIGFTSLFTSSIGLMSGFLAAIWATSKTHNFVREIIAILLLFVLPAIWSLYMVLQNYLNHS